MKQGRFIAAALAMLLLAGCAEKPDSDIVIHKDMEKVIDEAKQTDSEKQSVEELRQYSSYTADFGNDSLRVSIHADAKVDIPQTDKLSVFRVKQHSFTQAEFDTVRQALLGDTELYDGVTMMQDTKADIEQQIAWTRAELDSVTVKEPRTEPEKRDREITIAEYQKWLDELQEKYEAAPVEAEKVLSDGKLQNAAEMLRKGENKSYWEWQNELGCGETVDLRNADNTAMLYMQNNTDNSNKISFRSSPAGIEKIIGVQVTTYPLNAETIAGIADPFLDHDAVFEGAQPEQMTSDSCELTRAQAEEQAAAFLQQIGQKDFVCFEGGKYAEYLESNQIAHRYYRTCWILRYCREIGGVLLDQASGEKLFDGWKGAQYVKQNWPGEMIELHISDAGIVWLDWNAPLDITETVVNQAALKPFSEISSTFERMMPMIAAPPEQAEVRTDISIRRVALSYSRISEKDSFDTGLIVPVWGFIGTRKDYNDSDKTDRVQMAVNAIDGSVIDSELGY